MLQDAKIVSTGQRRILFGLVLILALATWLRFDGLTWAYTYRLHCDEAKFAHVISDMWEKFPLNHWLNPHFSAYGALPMYLALLLAPLAKLISGADLENINAVLLVGRGISATADIASVLLLFLLVQRIATARAGLWAAAFYAVALIGVRESHFFTPDTLATCMMLLFLYFASGLISTAKSRDWAIAGIVLGLTLSVKFSMFSLVLIGLIAWGMQVWASIGYGGDPKLFRMFRAARNMRLLVAGIFIFSVLPLAMWSLARPKIIGYGTTALVEKITDEKLETHSDEFWTSQVTSIYTGGQRFLVILAILGTGLSLLLFAAMTGERGLRVCQEAQIRLPILGAYLAAIPLTFIVLNPYAILQPLSYWSPAGPHTVTWNLLMANGTLWPPPGWAVRFEGTFPVIYQLLHIMPWALGLPLMAILLAGTIWACVMLVRKGLQANWPIFVAVALLLILLLGMHVKMTRYMLPLVPVMCAAAALWLEHNLRQVNIRKARIWQYTAGLVVVLSAFWCLAYLNIYRHPDNRVAAAQWLSSHVKPGEHVVFEKDDSWGAAGENLIKGAGVFTSDRFEPMKFTQDLMGKDIGSEDIVKKEQYIKDILQGADVFIMTDTNIRRLKHLGKHFSVVTQFYEDLVSGRTSFELVATFDNGPRLFGWRIPEEKVEESFTLFDHPKVFIYRTRSTVVQGT